jgi:hypothetical protein
MGLYNAAAWLMRREQHLAVNAVVYAALSAWEQKHVARHLDELRKCHQQTAGPSIGDTAEAMKELAA